MQESLKKAQEVHNHVQQMFDEGVLKMDINGDYTVVENPDERQAIKENVR